MLTNQMGNMVVLMERMQTSIDRLMQPEGMIQPDTGQAPTFVTPPPWEISHLSPMSEVFTPQTTPPTPNPPPFPPNLGRLTPAQLPLPPRTQDTRQKAVSTESDPIVSTAAASTSRPNQVQRTNPTTQPQYYQNMPSTQYHPPPLNPTTTQSQPTSAHNIQPQPPYTQPTQQAMPFTHNHPPNQNLPYTPFPAATTC
jgi:hypothetical protein